MIKLEKEPVRTVRGPSDIWAANIRLVSPGPLNHTDHFTNKAFTLALTLTDTDSKEKATLTFHGLVNGTMSPLHSNLTFTITDPHQKAHLGVHIYDVTLTTFRTFGTSWGSIYAHVDVHHNPEPGSLVLAGVGACCAGLASWRKRQRRRRASPTTA
jgi:hypothetical protein